MPDDVTDLRTGEQVRSAQTGERVDESTTAGTPPDSGTEVSEAVAGDPDPLGRSRPRALRRLSAAVSVFVVASLLAGWSGYSWWNAVHGDHARIAEARDSVLEASAQALVNFHTLDHRDVEKGLDSWERSATGRFLDELRQRRERDALALRESKTSTAGKTVSEAILDLDLAAGTARVIGVVEIVVTPPAGAPVTKRDRVQVELQRTGTGWKTSSIAPVSVGA